MELEFLKTDRNRILRTTLYGDQEFSNWELELLHTPIVQRLYNLKQLGFADRVYPDAVHSRFNHILGVAEIAERMAKRLVAWLSKNPTVSLTYAKEDAIGNPADWQHCSISANDLKKLVEDRIPVVRMIGLLHDLTHAAFGHTLEDEVCVFIEKHDDRPRQQRFFNALTGQLIYLWAVEAHAHKWNPDEFEALVQLEVKERDLKEWAEVLAAMIGPTQSQRLAARLRQLEMAFALLSFVEFLHEKNKTAVPPPPTLMVASAILALDAQIPPLDVILHRDAFLVDIVGNTICADLMDYAHRDAKNAGLRVQFDPRLIRYLCTVSVSGEKLSPTGAPCIRTALQFFTDKMRYDVLSEMSGILKARYLINERVLFHPTKCAAGAMLGTAAQLLGLDKVPIWMQVLGDQEFLATLIELGRRMTSQLSADAASASVIARDRTDDLVAVCLAAARKSGGDEFVAERIRGARTLLWQLASRRYPKLVYRLRSGIHHSDRENANTIASNYQDPMKRFRLEREVERQCALPPGAVVIHCPRRKMSMKVAEALVVGKSLELVDHLRDVDNITPEPLGPYTAEIKAVEEMYRAIWQLHGYLDPMHGDKSSLVERVLAEQVGFPADSLFHESVIHDETSPYTAVADYVGREFGWSKLPLVVQRLDREGALRMRHGKAESAKERALRIIREVEKEGAHEPPSPKSGEQLGIFASNAAEHKG